MTAQRFRVSLKRPAIGLLAVQWAALLAAACLLLLGVAGFVPGLTEGVGAMPLAGHHSGALLFGVFEVSVLHNLVHVVLGLAGFVLARTYARSRAYLLGGGLILLGLWLYGLLIAPGSTADVVALNNADNWLHFGLGATMVVLAVTLAGPRVPRGARGEVLLPPE